jgi:hypothetical protein
MFEDSLIESGNRFKAKRRLSTTILSFTLQVGLIGILILIPLIYTDALPKTQLMTFLVAPPPPPPPPPPPAAAPVKVVKMVSEVVNGQLRTHQDSRQSSDDQGRGSTAGSGAAASRAVFREAFREGRRAA